MSDMAMLQGGMPEVCEERGEFGNGRRRLRVRVAGVCDAKHGAVCLW